MFKRGILRVDWDDVDNVVFTCPHCGSHDFTSLEYDGHVSSHFDEGGYICWNCGKSVYGGKVFNYYHDCFNVIRKSKAVQLTFDF